MKVTWVFYPKAGVLKPKCVSELPGRLNHRPLGPTQTFESLDLEGGPKLAALISLQVMLMLLVQEPWSLPRNQSNRLPPLFAVSHGAMSALRY